MELAQGLLMIMDLWDTGLTDDIEDYIKKLNKKYADIPEMQIEIKENDFYEPDISTQERLFIAREIADELLHTPQ